MLGIPQLGLSSLPFVIAALSLIAAATYVGLMRGAPVLRATFLMVPLTALPWVLALLVVAGDPPAAVAETAFKTGLGVAVFSGYGALLFDLALARRIAQHLRLVVIAGVLSVGSAALCITTDLIIEGMTVTPSGMQFGVGGPLAWMHSTLIGAWVAIGSVILWNSLDAEPSPLRRRQFKGTIASWSVSALGVLDLALMYGIGWYPLSWLFLTLGAMIALRSLVADDLIHAAALDQRAVGGTVYLVAVIAAVWGIAIFVEDTGHPAVVAAVLAAAVFLVLRIAFALARFVTRGSSARDTPLDRALDRYVAALHEARTLPEIAAATEELLGLAVGSERVALLEPSDDDYSWRRAGGEPLPEAETPDPRLLAWLQDNPRPMARDELVAARLGDSRSLLEQLFEAHDAEVIAPLVSQDEVLGLLVLGSLPGGRALKPDEVEFLARVHDHATSALVYARMYRETHTRVEVAKEVELAGAVQEAFIPSGAVHELGAVQVCGAYEPATQCGGDWWTAVPLGRDRTLLMIGDVTGHGVAAAMVTAAAKGCYDVALRLLGANVGPVELLQQLHRAVKRAGGDQFHMTCFVSILDTRARTIHYANAGHVVPYLCRRSPANKRVSLDVLVARGNPLGAAERAEYKAHERAVEPGDVLVWYTDGVVECTNRQRQQYGDRRFQRSLKRLVQETTDIAAVRDGVLRDAFAFHEGHPADDDITLVVARLAD